MNQAPAEEKPNEYIRKIKTVQLIYIIEKVGLINQAPTKKSYVGNGAWPHFSQRNQIPYII